jgi:hypothetical protein
MSCYPFFCENGLINSKCAQAFIITFTFCTCSPKEVQRSSTQTRIPSSAVQFLEKYQHEGLPADDREYIISWLDKHGPPSITTNFYYFAPVIKGMPRNIKLSEEEKSGLSKTIQGIPGCEPFVKTLWLDRTPNLTIARLTVKINYRNYILLLAKWNTNHWVIITKRKYVS